MTGIHPEQSLGRSGFWRDGQCLVWGRKPTADLDLSRTLPSFLSTPRCGKVASTFLERPVITRLVLPTLAVRTSK